MRAEVAWGRTLQVVGMFWQFWGVLVDDDACRLRGYQLVVVGQMRVLGGRAAALARYCTPRQVVAAQMAPVTVRARRR